MVGAPTESEARGRADSPVRPARASDALAVVEFFREAGCRCHCQYWQFEEDDRSWQVVCAQSPEQNALGLARDLAEGSITALVQTQGERVIGWLRLEREARLKKLYQKRLYKGLPCFQIERAGGAAIACMLVAPSERRQGVARDLVTAALRFCLARGDRFLEAFPRGQQDVSDEEQWMGPLPIYRSLGFRVVSDFAPYPVMRLDFSGTGEAT